MSLGNCDRCGRALIQLMGQEDSVRCSRCGYAAKLFGQDVVKRKPAEQPKAPVAPRMLQEGMTVVPIGGDQAGTVPVCDVPAVMAAKPVKRKEKAKKPAIGRCPRVHDVIQNQKCGGELIQTFGQETVTRCGRCGMRPDVDEPRPIPPPPYIPQPFLPPGATVLTAEQTRRALAEQDRRAAAQA